jgi:hypothetical protein
MIKEVNIKLNLREVEVIRMALDNQKLVIKIGTCNDNKNKKERAINELYNIESVENKLKDIK